MAFLAKELSNGKVIIWDSYQTPKPYWARTKLCSSKHLKIQREGKKCKQVWGFYSFEKLFEKVRLFSKEIENRVDEQIYHRVRHVAESKRKIVFLKKVCK